MSLWSLIRPEESVTYNGPYAISRTKLKSLVSLQTPPGPKSVKGQMHCCSSSSHTPVKPSNRQSRGQKNEGQVRTGSGHITGRERGEQKNDIIFDVTIP